MMTEPQQQTRSKSVSFQEPLDHKAKKIRQRVSTVKQSSASERIETQHAIDKDKLESLHHEPAAKSTKSISVEPANIEPVAVVDSPSREMHPEADDERSQGALFSTWSHGHQDFVYIFAIVVFAMGLYVNSINGEFAFDDRFAVVENDDSKSTSPVWNIFWHDFWGQDISNIESHKSYRPLTILSFRLNHMLSEDGTFYYHLGNVLLHGVTCILAYLLGKSVVKLFNVFRLGYSRFASFFAALIFAIHPVHTESVSGIVGRADVLSAVFFIGALLYYMDGAQENNSDVRKLALAGIFYMASTLAKETGFTVLAIMVLYDILLIPNESPMIPFLHKKRSVSSFSRRMLYILFLASIYLIGRKWITVHFTLYNYRPVENPIAYTEGASRVLSILYLHWRYAWLLVFPMSLSVDYSYNCVPVIESLGEWRNIGWIALYASICHLIYKTIRDIHLRSPFGIFSVPKTIKRKPIATTEVKEAKSTNHDPIYLQETYSSPNRLLFSLGFLVATFIPSSNLFVFVGTMIAERLLYMPSLGFCFMLAHFWEQYPVQFKRFRSTRNTVFVLVILVFSIRTWTRNHDWISEEHLFEKAMDVCPDSVKVRLNNGILQRRYSDWDAAFAEFNKALEIMPSFCDPYHWIALTHINAGEKFEVALPYFREGAKCKYTRSMTLRVLNTIYDTLTKTSGNSMSHIQDWADILILAEQYEEASKYYRSIGMYHRENGNKLKSKESLLKSVELDPDSCESNYWLGVTYMEMDNQTKAIEALERSLKCDHAISASVHALAPIYDRLVMENPNKPELKIRYADVILKGNMTTQAARLYYMAGREALLGMSYAVANRAFKKVIEAHQHLHEVRTESAFADLAGFSAEVDDPMWCDVHLWYGRTLMSTNNMKEAMIQLKSAIECGSEPIKDQAEKFHRICQEALRY